MNVNELPTKYYELAKQRWEERETHIPSEINVSFEEYVEIAEGNIAGLFTFALTPEGHEFWAKCAFAKTPEELPSIHQLTHHD